MALNKLEGRITVPTGGWSISVNEGGGGVTVTVAAADYYLTTAGSGSRSLLAELEFQLDSLMTGAYTVSLDDTADNATGKVTISATGVGSFSITWTSTSIRDALGFTGNVSGATTYTGSNQARYLWLPNVRRANLMGAEPSSTSFDLGVQVEDGTFTMAPSGASKKLAYNRRRIDTLEYRYLLGNKSLLALETTTNESWERFYQDVIQPGYPFRLHPDRSSDSVYFTWKADSTKAGMGVEPIYPGWVNNASSQWAVRLPIFKNV